MKFSFTIRRLVGPLLLCSLLFASIFTTLSPQPAYAMGTFTVLNANLIRGTGDVFDTGQSNVTADFKRIDGRWLAAVITGGNAYSLELTDFTKNSRGTGWTALMKIDGGKQIRVPISDPTNILAGNPPSGGGGAAEEEKKEPIDCPIEPNQSGRWLFCDLLFIPLTKATNVLDSVLNEYLSTGNAIFNDEQLKDKYQTAWSVFRNLGIGLLVIAGLVMLISEALGLSIIDAYTVRKVLPRLLVAIIGISISWELCEFLVGFFDDLGAAMGNIIYSSFDIGVGGINVTEAIVSALLAGGGITTVGLTLGAFGILSLLGTLLLAMLVGAVVLILRQAIIIAAVLLAPLAIAAYVLPNTNKLSNFWWDTLIRMLMLYPIATGIIALCKVLGNITMSADTATSTLEGVIALITGMIFFIGGYALIPLAFRLTGGLVATIGGLANDRTRGGFDRLKNYRKNKSAENIGKMKTGTRFQGNMYGTRNASKLFNAASVRAATGTKGHFGVGERGRQAVSQAREQAMLEQVMKNPSWNTINQNDDALQALSYDNQAEARAGLRAKGWSDQRISSAVGAARASVGFGAAQKLAAGRQLVSTGTGFTGHDVYDGAGNVVGHVSAQQEMAQTLARASSGNESQMSSLAGFANAETKKVGRFDLAPSYGNLNNLVRAEAGIGSFGAIRDPMTGAGAANAQEAYNTTTRAAWNSASLYSLVNGKDAQTRTFANHWRRQLSQPITAAAGTAEHQAQLNSRNEAAIAMVELQQALSSASAGNQTIINETIASTGYNPNANVSLENHIASRYGTTMTGDALRSNARVIDYGARGAAGQAAATGAPGVGGPPGGPATSDRRLKRSITPIEITESGIQLYRFKYIWSDQEYVGVMAQDILETYPEAVYVDASGFYGVYYDMLDLQMMPIEEYTDELVATADRR